jgi:hypothetical protein
MGYDIDTIVLNIDSRFRNFSKNISCSKFTFDLENQLKNISSITLSSVELPNLFYTFSEKKKNISFVVNNTKINIPPGNYCAENLIEIINKKLSTLASIVNISLELKFNPTDGKILISEKDKKPFSINFENSSEYPSLGYQLGFRQSSYNSKSEYITESILDTIGDNYVFIKLNDYGSLINTHSGNKYFAKIILYNNKNTVIFDNNSNFICKTYNFLQPVNISRFNIELVDLYDNGIDMNNLDFSLTIELQQIYNYDAKKVLEDFSFGKISNHY